MSLRRRRLGALATAALATASLAWLPATSAQAASAGDPVEIIGASIAGYSIETTQGRHSPQLYEVRINGSVTTQSYCIETQVFLGRSTAGSVLRPWADFAGTNAFKTDASVREHVSWITRNTYPAVSLDALEQASGIADLSTREAVTASQAAIWAYTDGSMLTGVIDAPLPDAADIKALYEYLRGPANVGAPENTGTDSLEVALDGPRTAKPGERVGPYTLAGTHSATVTVPGGLTAVDEQGAPIDLTNVAVGTRFYLQVPSDAAPSTSYELAASAKAISLSSFIVHTPGDPSTGADHQQTIIVADDATRTTRTALTLTIQSAPTPTPTPTPTTPAPTTPASTTPASTAPAPTAPASTTPAPTTPAPTTPAPTAPASTTPAPTAPAPTTPASTAPAPTAPAPTAPAPTAPASTAPAPVPTTPATTSPASPVPTTPAEGTGLATTGADAAPGIALAAAAIGLAAAGFILRRRARA
ncbi:hypothetical protein USB125703_00504 [Pseudoclavibacter triregionum]|nr:hypothetical protein USB125703_00504 [Pseudoclavibacter triregionum]